MFTLLPNDIIHLILNRLYIEDIIYLYRINLSTMNLFNNKDFINKLSLIRINTYVDSFKEFCELYNQKYITYHSMKYFSLEECLRRSAASDIKYIKFYKQLGANNLDEFFISACEFGNLSILKLSIKFLRKNNTDIV